MTSVRRMAARLHPSSRRLGLTIVLKAFLDASGKPHEDPVVVVAGFVSSTDAWEEFERQWNTFLLEFGLERSRFHSAPFAAHKRPFADWSDDKWKAAVTHICRIMEAMRPLGCGIGVNVEAFREWRAQTDSQIHPDPYYQCLDWTLRPLIRGVVEMYPDDSDEGITIYCDQEPEHEFLGKAAADWHANFLRKTAPHTPLFADPNREIDMHYGSAITYVPLQLADILAHNVFQMMRDSMRSPDNWEKPVFLDCLNSHCFLSVRTLYDVESIEAYATQVKGQDDRLKRGFYDKRS